MKKRILITGASGYLGKHLIKRLLKEDYQLVALVRDLSRMPAWLMGTEKLTVVEGDLKNKQSLKKAIGGVDLVFHLAASLRTFERNNQLRRANIVGLKNLLSAYKKSGRQPRFIFASSIDAISSSSDYGQSKLKGEEIVQRQLKSNYSIVRIGHVYDEENGGVVNSIKQIADQANWKSSLLFHCLKERRLSPLKLDHFLGEMVKLAKQPKSKKLITLADEELMVGELIKKQPREIPFGCFLLKAWVFLGRLLGRADLLIYLSLRND